MTTSITCKYQLDIVKCEREKTRGAIFINQSEPTCVSVMRVMMASMIFSPLVG